ncbi:hypothetical protein OG609_43890 [Streptomyces sp. NBC_01224]|uniref:hypothetical protein n=1 Tax=Streptomyces sp. NBC_01224 TaxID=2903783 RepID=UPI002E1040D1|nr:hypothetical protein OG609_43890 [Streptomyces sp. NBC_01224]
MLARTDGRTGARAHGRTAAPYASTLVARARPKGGEPHGVVAGFGVGGDDARAAQQRVGDADTVVVGVEQRVLVAADERCAEAR